MMQSTTEPNRLTVRIEDTAPGGAVQAFYLKRHWTRCVGRWLWSAITRRSLRSPALIEVGNVSRCRAADVPTLRLAAWGEQRPRPWAIESFLVSEELPDAVPLDDLLRDRYGDALTGESFRAKRRLIERAALLVARFHRADLNHRDLYLCHLFVGRADERSLWLIDLQRVQRRRRLRRRWLVKDIAQLAYSALATPATRADGLRFMRAYFGVGRLGREHKAFIRRVLRKRRRIARHDRIPR